MAEKMLVTQALDERDLLVKKIGDKIAKASFTDVKKHNEEKVMEGRLNEADFSKDAESAYQQIMDLIQRFQKIDAAIVASNAATRIQTSYGEFTVAGAISLRSRLRGSGVYEEKADFEGSLLRKMQNDYAAQVRDIEAKNADLVAGCEHCPVRVFNNNLDLRELCCSILVRVIDLCIIADICSICRQRCLYEIDTCLKDLKRFRLGFFRFRKANRDCSRIGRGLRFFRLFHGSCLNCGSFCGRLLLRLRSLTFSAATA